MKNKPCFKETKKIKEKTNRLETNCESSTKNLNKKIIVELSSWGSS